MSFEFPEEELIIDTESYQQFVAEFDCNIRFFQQLSELISINGFFTSFITDKDVYELDTSLLDSAVQTLKSIKSCCRLGSLADANTLIRKFRDDSFLYIFILDIIRNRNPFNEEEVARLVDEDNKLDLDKFAASFGDIRINIVMDNNEKAVEAWFEDALNDLPHQIRMKLSFDNYMKKLKQDPNISKILFDYHLEQYWETLRQRLNDYVHNNGKQFTHQNLLSASSSALGSSLKDINSRTSYISTFFLVLLLMVDAKSVCSTDFIDYMDSGIDPPQDCQYLIANFVQRFIDAKVVKLHPELKQYLSDNNNHGMKIE